MRRIGTRSGFLIALVACAPGLDPGGGGTSSASGSDDTTAAVTSTTVPIDDTTRSSTMDTGVGSSDETTTSGGTQETGSTGAPICEPVVPGEFTRCFDGTMYDGTLCNWMGTSESVGIASCLMAAGGEGSSVCMIIGCEERCDCFAPPATGTASVECMEGIIGGDTACVLYCGAGEVCPDGMVCGSNICVWEWE